MSGRLLMPTEVQIESSTAEYLPKRTILAKVAAVLAGLVAWYLLYSRLQR